MFSGAPQCQKSDFCLCNIDCERSRSNQVTQSGPLVAVNTVLMHKDEKTLNLLQKEIILLFLFTYLYNIQLTFHPVTVR